MRIKAKPLKVNCLILTKKHLEHCKECLTNEKIFCTVGAAFLRTDTRNNLLKLSIMKEYLQKQKKTLIL